MLWAGDIWNLYFLSPLSEEQSSSSWDHPHYTSDRFLRAWAAQCAAAFSCLQYVVMDCSLPFREVFLFFSFFLVQMEMKELRSANCPRAIRGETSDFNAVVPHSLILLWRRNRWRKEIYIDFDWILCFVILKGHNYFHCEVFMIQQNCFLAKHNRFEACLIVVSCFHFCLF